MDSQAILKLESLIPAMLWSLLAAVIFYTIGIVATDGTRVAAAAAQLEPEVWLAILGLSLLNYLLRFARWQGYLHLVGHPLPLLRSLTYYVAGFAFTTTPGKAGELVRSLYLKRDGVGYVKSVAAFFSERLLDLLAIVLLALSAAVLFEQVRWVVVTMMLLTLGFLPLLHSMYLQRLLRRLQRRVHSERWHHLLLQLRELLASAIELLRARPLWIGLLLGLAAWGAEGVAFSILLGALGIKLSLPLAVGIYSVSVLVGAVSFLPGGLGGTEAVMVLLLVLVGADSATAVAATLICRVVTLWFAVALGLLCVGGLILRPPTSLPVIEGT